MFERTMWEPEVLKVHEFFTELLSMEGKYPVKLSITELFMISRKIRKRYNCRLWKMQMWFDSCSHNNGSSIYRPVGGHNLTSYLFLWRECKTVSILGVLFLK